MSKRVTEKGGLAVEGEEWSTLEDRFYYYFYLIEPEELINLYDKAGFTLTITKRDTDESEEM